MSSGDLQFEDLQDLVGRELDGRYVLEKFIDRGGYGAVYRGNDKKFNQSVAIKVGLSSREFMKEARLAAEVKHNHIVQVSDFGSDKGIAYLVMEFLHGEDLEKLFKKQGSQLSPEQLRKFVNEVGDALAYAHADQLIHRDLKPRNVILREHVSKAGTSTGNSKFVLLDFGIAAKLDSEGTQRNRTQDGAGTVEYMAPELLGREPRATPQSDIYAFGVILYQMLTGQVPFPQADTSHMALAECLNAICRAAPPPFRDVAPDRHHPAAIEALVMQCLEKDPARRPASMGEVRERYIEAHDRAQKRPVTVKRPTRNLVNTIRPTDLIDADEEDEEELAPALPKGPVRTPPPRSSSIGPWIFLLLMGMGGGGWYAYKQATIPPASVSLTDDGGKDISDDTPVVIEAGTSVKLTYIVDLHRDGQVDFEVVDHPQGVDVALTNGPLSGTSQYVTISVTDLNPKVIEPPPIVLRASAPGHSESWERQVKITIGRPSLSWRPAELNALKFVEAPDSRRVKLGGKIFATILQRDIAGQPVRFRLIPAKRIDDRSVDTFYILEQLVTNQMFNEFAKENVDFELTPRKPDERTWERKELAESPVTDVCVLEAQKFAWWLGSAQIATLPSTLEWEIAAGYRDFIQIIKDKNGETSIENIGDDKLREFKRVKFEGHPLGATAWIGTGPTLGLYQDVDGEQLNERSPYGCLFPLLPNGRRAIEFTRSLNTLSFKTSDLRVICQHGIPNQHDPVLKDYSAVMRGVKEDRDEKEILWVTEYLGELKIKTDSDLTDEVGECPLRVIDRPDGRKSSWSFRVVLLPDATP